MRSAIFHSFLFLAACGARTDVLFSTGTSDDDDDHIPDVPDASVPPIVDPCEVYWQACTPRTDAIVVSDGMGQAPDVAWDSQELLVVYDARGGNELAALSLDGQIDWRTTLAGGIQAVRLAWNPVTGTGLFVADSAIGWLGDWGVPTGEVIPVSIDSSQLAGDAAATADGFVVLTGTNAYTSPPPLYYANVAPTGAEPTFTLLAEGGPRAPAEHDDGPDGLARWAVSSVYWANTAEVYRLSAGAADAPELAYDLSGLLPNEGNGVATAVAEHAGQLYVLYAGAPATAEEPGWQEWMLRVGAAPDGTTVVDPVRIDLSSNGGLGALFVLGDTLVVASSAIHPEHRVSLAAYDPASPDPVGSLLVLAPTAAVSHSPRITPTPTGFAVVWNESESYDEDLRAMLQVYDCCPRD